MADPKPLTRRELEQFLPSQRAIRAFEELFKLIPPDLISLQSQIDDLNLNNSTNANKAQQALDLLERFVCSLELLANSPPPTFPTSEGDLSPSVQVGTLGEQQATAAQITGGNVTANLRNNQTILLESTSTLSNGAAAAAGTLTNAPTAGDPTKWIAINDNGTTRYIPTW